MEILEEETCKECGSPVWLCRNQEASNVGFKVKTSTCFARAELDRWNEREEKKKGKTRYGEYPFVVPYTYDGTELPSRMQFYRGLAEKHRVE